MSKIKNYLLITAEVVVESTKFFLGIYLIYRVYNDDIMGNFWLMSNMENKNPAVVGLIALAGAYLIANSKIPDSLKEYLKN